MMPKPKITIGAERSLNQDRYRMTLIEVSASNADNYRTVCSTIACVAFSEMQSGTDTPRAVKGDLRALWASPEGMGIAWI